MSTPGLSLLGCTLATLGGEVRFDGTGWTERLSLEVHHGEGCEAIELLQPDGVLLFSLRTDVLPGDARRYRLDEARYERTTTEDGVLRVRVLLPDLEPGDRALLSIERAWQHATDYLWSPHGADYAELKLPRGFTPELVGITLEERFAWAAHAPEHAALRLPHPWADRSAPAIPFLDERGAALAVAKARLDDLPWLSRAWDGEQPVVGAAALARGAVDDRGYARTLAALCLDGPDEVLLGRWVPHEGASPAPGATEVAVAWTPAGGTPQLHPQQTVQAGVLITARGPVPIAEQVGVERPAPNPAVATTLTAVLRPGDPRQRLHPRGGAQLDVGQTLTWQDLTTAHTLFVPLPTGARGGNATVETPGTARLTPYGLWLVVAPGTTAAEIGWTTPLGDAWGELPPSDQLQLAVGETRDAFAAGTASAHITPTGELLSDGDGTWRITRVGDVELLTDRDRFARELRARRYAASYPEPGMPLGLRGAFSGWELFEVLAPSLFERAQPYPLRPVPYGPRPLQAARRSRVLTEYEFAAIVAGYAQQARMRAEVVPVHPLGPTAAPLVTPRGFDHALLWVESDGEVRWADVACDLCDTWEIRPELVGAPAIGTPNTPAVPLIDGLPEGLHAEGPLVRADASLPSGVGFTELDSTGPIARWTLRGAAALQLRRALADLPDGSRAEALHHRLGAAPTSLIGLDTRGAEISAQATSSPEPQLDDVLVPAADAVWTPYLGLWSWVRPDPRPDGTWSCEGPGWRWRTVRTDARSTHQLLITERRLALDTPELLRRCLNDHRLLPGSTELAEPDPPTEDHAGEQ